MSLSAIQTVRPVGIAIPGMADSEQRKQKMGSAQEFEETRILGCFLENDEFGLGDRHALGLEQ